MLEGGHGPGAPDELVLNRDYRGRVTGLVYYGLQLVLAADDAAALDALAVETRKHRALRSFVGPKPAVDGLWERVRTWHAAPSIVRAAQPLYALTPGRAARAGRGPPCGRAQAEEAELVAEHSARMILGELGYDPRANRAAFVAGVRRGDRPRAVVGLDRGRRAALPVQRRPAHRGDGPDPGRLDAARAARPRLRRARAGRGRAAACSPARRRSRSTSTTSTRRRSRSTSGSASARVGTFATYLFP